jgi:hypothetical protein
MSLSSSPGADINAGRFVKFVGVGDSVSGEVNVGLLDREGDIGGEILSVSRDAAVVVKVVDESLSPTVKELDSFDIVSINTMTDAQSVIHSPREDNSRREEHPEQSEKCEEVPVVTSRSLVAIDDGIRFLLFTA